MATRYWVGGSGTWDTSDTTHWAASSGGASGASNPTSADDVVFDTLSNATAYTVSISPAVSVKDVTIGAPLAGDMTLAGSAQLNVYGNFTLYAGMVRSYTGQIVFRATATGKTITMAGQSFGSSDIVFTGVGGGWTLQDTFAVGAITLTNGALDLNGKTVSTATFNISNSNTRTLTMGAAAVTCAGWVATTTTGLTFSGASSTITESTNFLGGGLTYGTVILNSTSTCSLTGANTFGTLTRTNASGYASLTLSANQTVTGTFTVTGNNASTQRIYVASDTVGTARTITAAVVALTNVDFEDITAAGAAAPFTGTSIGNCGGNTSITQTTPVTAYWVGDGTASHPITDALWFTTSGGAVASRFPLPQDTGVFDANSFPASGKTITVGISGLRTGTLNFTGATNTPTLNFNNDLYTHGSITLISTMTISGAAELTFHGRGSCTLTSAGKTLSGVRVDAFGGTLALQDALITSTSTNVPRGTFTTNSYAVSCSVFNSSFSTTRTLNMGSTVCTVTAAGTAWDLTTVTGLTFNGSSSTIVFTNASSSAKTFEGGGKTYGSLTLSGVGTGTYTINNASGFFTGTTTISNTGAGVVLTLFGAASMTFANVVFSGFVGTWSGSTAGSISGNLTLVSGMTFTYSGTLTFTATGAATITSAGKTFNSTLTFDGVGGIWTFADAFVLSATKTLTLTNGTLDALTNNVAMTMGALSSSNSNVRAISMGSGTWTFTGSGTWWDTGTSTNLTVTCGTSTIKATDETVATHTFKGGGKTYYNIWLASTVIGYNNDFEGDNTFNDFKCDTPGHTLRFKDGTTTTVTTWHVNGASGNLTTLVNF